MASLFVLPWQQVVDANSAVYSGALLYFYDVGTTTPKTVYTDSALSIAHASPVVADSAGRFAPIYMQQSQYRVQLRTSGGTLIKDQDNVDPGQPLTSGLLPISLGGTAASTAAAARSNLGVPNIAGDTFTGDVYIQSTDASASAGPKLGTYRNSPTPANLDDLGTITFEGNNASGQRKFFAQISSSIRNTTAAAEEGRLNISLLGGGASVSPFWAYGGSSTGTTGFGTRNALVVLSNNEYGFSTNLDGETTIAATGTAPLRVKRDADGTLVNFYSGTTNQGSISVAGATVTYGAFCGVHLTQGLTGEILVGTVIETVDAMAHWSKDDDQTNETLPKCKVSDTPSSKRVYGVFSHFDEDGDAQVAGLGEYKVRIAAGVTVSGGDLLESNGDGCARVQADDLIRSSTLAKVAASVTVRTFPDGSYLVPCTLMAG